MMRSHFAEPRHLGTDRFVFINGLVDLITGAAGNETTEHDLSKPQEGRRWNWTAACARWWPGSLS